MKTTNFCSGFLATAFYFLNAVRAQDIATHGIYTEPNTGITFYASYQQDTPGVPGEMLGGGAWGGFVEGVALPANAATVDADEFIGLIIAPTPLTPTNGWAGILQGTEDADGTMWAGMIRHLMVIAFPSGNGNEIHTSLRYSVAYENPVPYLGSAKLSKLYQSVNSTHYTLVYRCQGCFVFDDPSLPTTRAYTSKGKYLKGWGAGMSPPEDKTNPNSDMFQHDNGCGWFQVDPALAANAKYATWAALPVIGGPTTPVPTPTPTYISKPVPTGKTYDYVVIGGGAGGIPLADRLSQAGKSVLLIEKGVASSARWGGTMRPESGWLDGTNLTWFDVPGQCNRIWNGGSAGVACTDTDQMAGCILGGGTAVNAGLWWKPNPVDWDYNFPTGWKSADMASSSQKLFARIPGTDAPSQDGKRYLLDRGFEVVRAGLTAAGWKSITANNVPAEKNKVFAHTPYMYINGERGGPMATYLLSASKRSNFALWLNTSVERINRVGGHATGLNVKATNNGGYVGEVKLTPITGRVVVSAGSFGTAKLLMRTGIGPKDQLEVVATSPDGPTFYNQSDWIVSPVGYNLDDHLNTDLVISHPNISYYDWPLSWTTPNATDKNLYLTKRSGPFSQAAPNIGPLAFEEIKGPDGITRSFQWTSRVEGSRGVDNGNTMTLSLYLGRGSVSRGRTTISKNLNMQVSTLPWGNANDLATTAIAIDNMVKALAPVKNLTWVLPPKGQSGKDYLASVPLNLAEIGSRRANHWMGTAKMGTDSGINGGTSVVDTNTRVYGTDNIFVVDASVFPGMVTTNPSSYVLTVAEKASDKLLNLANLVPAPKFGQCSGRTWDGSRLCVAGTTCTVKDEWYGQCL